MVFALKKIYIYIYIKNFFLKKPPRYNRNIVESGVRHQQPYLKKKGGWGETVQFVLGKQLLLNTSVKTKTFSHFINTNKKNKK